MLNNIFSQITGKIARYVDVHVRLVKITVIEKSSALMSYFMLALITLFVLFCILLFMGFGLVEAFIAAGLSRVAATFLVPVIYILLLAILLGMRKSIVRGFSNMFVKVLTDDAQKDDEEEDAAEGEKN